MYNSRTQCLIRDKGTTKERRNEQKRTDSSRKPFLNYRFFDKEEKKKRNKSEERKESEPKQFQAGDQL
ncbi:hypothetical protein D9611_002755 [Ephemerocybe angulata]|uniref:Uncharacterized protein n=1 Tax=Ephemerocybe angulata TaxID=980116 RepID=A0A8H5C1D6_9AGAR|nr:hypothetical protein D9611_002755 [Tulosesus angulatus]